MDDLDTLIRSASNNLHRDLPTPRIEPRISPRGDKAGELSEPLRPAERSEIFLKNWIGRRLAIGKNDHCVGIVHDVAVLQGEIRYDLGSVGAPMAGEAGHTWLATEVRAVEGVHHLNHPARPSDRRGCDGKRIPIDADFLGMAVAAVITQGGGKHSHRVHEFVHGNSFENLDVFEDGVRQLRVLVWRNLTGGRH